jgi:hypothetical protein
MLRYFPWTFYSHPVLPDLEQRTRDARDLALNLLLFAVLFAGGWLGGGLRPGTSLFVRGGCVRVVAIGHTTFIVNSVNHLWGYPRAGPGRHPASLLAARIGPAPSGPRTPVWRGSWAS